MLLCLRTCWRSGWANNPITKITISFPNSEMFFQNGVVYFVFPFFNCEPYFPKQTAIDELSLAIIDVTMSSVGEQ